MSEQLAAEAMTGFREALSPDGLRVRAARRRNPYGYLMSAEQFDDLLLSLGMRRAESIWRNHTADAHRATRGVYARACMGFVMLDPTVGRGARTP